MSSQKFTINNSHIGPFHDIKDDIFLSGFVRRRTLIFGLFQLPV